MRCAGIVTFSFVCFALCCVCFVTRSVAYAEQLTTEQPAQQTSDAGAATPATNAQTEKKLDDLGIKIDGLYSSLGEQGAKLDQVNSGVTALRTTNEQQTAQTITIDATQWEYMQKSDQIQNFFLLVLSLLVSALLGTRLWDAFSRGWRR